MTKRISQLTLGTALSGSELFEIVQDTNSFSASAGMIRKYVFKSYAKLSDVKAYNVDGGTFTSGAWRTRDLNTIDNNDDGIVLSLASNQFTLGPGIYYIYASAPAAVVNSHVARLYNITDSSETIVGTAESTAASTVVVTGSIIRGRFTITSNKVFEIQHQTTTTKATNGFGVKNNISGINNVYTIVEIWKVN